MRKLLVFLVMLGIFGFLGASFVSANSTQNVTSIVTADLNLVPTPNPLDFGSLFPGQSSAIKIITLTPGTSNLLVTPSATSIFQYIQLNIGNGYNVIGNETISITASQAKDINSRLDVPVGYHSGTYSSIITYTVLEAPI
jgi:hypothetical protein